MEEIIDKFNVLLKESKKFQFQNDEKTFFEITKYPYRETVASNILAFYFNINEEHQLGGLFIKALIKCINKKVNIKIIDDNIEINNITVEPEYYTETGKRIDIVIHNEEFAIGIENKLEATLYNDLEDYAKTINEINDKNYKVVLSIKPVDEEKLQKNKFVNILYKEFFTYIREELKYEKDKENKWCTFFNEFQKTIEKKEVTDLMNEDFTKWYIENKEDIEDFMKKIIDMHDKACKKVNDLGELLDKAMEHYGYNEKKTTRYNNSRRIDKDPCSSICNIRNINIDNQIDVTIDNIYFPNGWELRLYTSKKQYRNKIIQLLKKENISSSIFDNNRIKLYEFEDNDPEYKEIIEKNIELLKIFTKNENK